MDVPVELLIAIVGLVAAAIFGVTTAVGSLRKEAREDGSQHGEIAQKLDSLLSMLTDVRRDVDDIHHDNTENRERIVRLETRAEMTSETTDKSIDSLHRKVRKIEDRVHISTKE